MIFLDSCEQHKLAIDVRRNPNKYYREEAALNLFFRRATDFYGPRG